MTGNQLFTTKSLDDVKSEMEGGDRLHRVLGPFSLTALGIGAIIGAGIFVATGSAAREVAGPALMLSYVVAGVTCIFAALCYAEFASMAPVAGSAYTYAYCTLGELFAWIIGWDLVLEYAVGAATVANGWSGYFQSILGKLGIIVPMALCAAPVTYDDGVFRANVYAEYRTTVVDKVTGEPKEVDARATHKLLHLDRIDDKGEKVLGTDGKPETVHVLSWVNASNSKTVLGKVGDPEVEKKLTIQQAYMNLPAILIVLLITAILVKGISESASFNAVMVVVKVAAVLFVIIAGAFFINPANWTDKGFAPFGYGGFSFFGIFTIGTVNEHGRPVGMLAGAAIIFFAYIGFDAVSTQAEEAKNPKRDVPIGIIGSLVICTILYIAVVAVLTGMVPYDQIDKDAGVSSAFQKASEVPGVSPLMVSLLGSSEVIIAIAGVAGITSVLLVMMMSGPRVFLAMARDGLVPRKFFADVHPTFKTPWKSTIAVGVFVLILAGLLPIDALLELTNIGTLFAFVVVCAAVLVMRRTNPTAERHFKVPFSPVVPVLGILMCLMLMLSLPLGNWLRLVIWLALGLVIYFSYGQFHSVLGQRLKNQKGSASA